MSHFHHCPHCYEAWECTAGCTIEPDLEDRGRSFASHWHCQKLVCLIESAAERHDRRLQAYESQKQLTLARLQTPPRIVGVSERVHDQRWSTVELQHRPQPQHRFNSWADALQHVGDGGEVVLLGGTHRIPPRIHDGRGVSVVVTHGAHLDARDDVTFENIAKVVAHIAKRGPRKPTKVWHSPAAPSKIRPHGVR